MQETRDSTQAGYKGQSMLERPVELCRREGSKKDKAQTHLMHYLSVSGKVMERHLPEFSACAQVACIHSGPRGQLGAIFTPSQHVYMVSVNAVELVEGWAQGKRLSDTGEKQEVNR